MYLSFVTIFPFRLSSKLINKVELLIVDGLSFPLLLLFCLSSCKELVSDVCIFRWQCPAEALPLPLGVPLKSTIQRLKKEVLHLTKKLKKSEGELCQAKKCYSEVNPLK